LAGGDELLHRHGGAAPGGSERSADTTGSS
jgi:hypothetical protein